MTLEEYEVLQGICSKYQIEYSLAIKHGGQVLPIGDVKVLSIQFPQGNGFCTETCHTDSDEVLRTSGVIEAGVTIPITHIRVYGESNDFYYLTNYKGRKPVGQYSSTELDYILAYEYEGGVHVTSDIITKKLAKKTLSLDSGISLQQKVKNMLATH